MFKIDWNKLIKCLETKFHDFNVVLDLTIFPLKLKTGAMTYSLEIGAT